MGYGMLNVVFQGDLTVKLLCQIKGCGLRAGHRVQFGLVVGCTDSGSEIYDRGETLLHFSYFNLSLIHI